MISKASRRRRRLKVGHCTIWNLTKIINLSDLCYLYPRSKHKEYGVIYNYAKTKNQVESQFLSLVMLKSPSFITLPKTNDLRNNAVYTEVAIPGRTF